MSKQHEALLTDLCRVCHKVIPKYKCPRCYTATCSLACVRRHKQWDNCSGVRDRTEYVKKSELASESSLNNDYNFLADVERLLDRGARAAARAKPKRPVGKVARLVDMKRENPARATPVKEEPASHALDDARDESSPLSSAHTTDIEDLLGPTAESTTLKRKHEEASQEDAIKPEEDETGKATSAITSSRSTRATKSHGSPRKPKTPLNLQPPPNWEELYDRVKEMRLRNPTAPVDTMGCAELYARDSSDRDKRFHILVALMLSAQTKDTVTALAMQRLHTELGDGEDMKTEDAQSEKVAGQAESKEIALANYTPPRKSNLTLENILAVSPARLDELIRTVGFHNNKTKYIKAAAVMIRDEFNSDIPRTPKDLMRLPGVGPKMAYLAMSAAWGEVHGIGVDVHVHRITNLWGWVKTKTPEETRLALESWLPREKWGEINHLLVGLGQTVCLPVGRRCGECDLAGTGLCKAEIKGWKDKRQKRTKVVKDEEEGEEEGKIKVEMEE